MKRSVPAASPEAYVAPATVKRLTADAVKLNVRVGDPTRVARPSRSRPASDSA